MDDPSDRPVQLGTGRIYRFLLLLHLGVDVTKWVGMLRMFHEPLNQVGRRFKITNPDKFRSFYGKMMFMLQDAQASGRAGLTLVNEIQVCCVFYVLSYCN